MKKLVYYTILSTITCLVFLGLVLLFTAVGTGVVVTIEVVSELLGAFFFSDFEYQGFGFDVNWLLVRLIGFISALITTRLLYVEADYPQCAQNLVDKII